MSCGVRLELGPRKGEQCGKYIIRNGLCSYHANKKGIYKSEPRSRNRSRIIPKKYNLKLKKDDSEHDFIKRLNYRIEHLGYGMGTSKSNLFVYLGIYQNLSKEVYLFILNHPYFDLMTLNFLLNDYRYYELHLYARRAITSFVSSRPDVCEQIELLKINEYNFCNEYIQLILIILKNTKRILSSDMFHTLLEHFPLRNVALEEIFSILLSRGQRVNRSYFKKNLWQYHIDSGYHFGINMVILHIHKISQTRLSRRTIRYFISCLTSSEIKKVLLLYSVNLLDEVVCDVLDYMFDITMVDDVCITKNIDQIKYEMKKSKPSKIRRAFTTRRR